MRRSHSHFCPSAWWLTASFILAGCAHDPYQAGTDQIKAHVEAFYAHLKADRIEAAIHENEQIETLASQLGETIRSRTQRPGVNRMDREWALVKTANETAAQNWLALGQYFAIKKRYDQARAAYRRVVDTYTGSSERMYREQAARALRDLDMMSPSAKQP
jgi:tetratricopeptide (TPR) repeat protein